MLRERKCHPFCCLGALQRLLCRSCLFRGQCLLLLLFLFLNQTYLFGGHQPLAIFLAFSDIHLQKKKGEELSEKGFMRI